MNKCPFCETSCGNLWCSYVEGKFPREKHNEQMKKDLEWATETLIEAFEDEPHKGTHKNSEEIRQRYGLKEGV